MIYETCMNDDDEMLKHLSEVENKGILHQPLCISFNAQKFQTASVTHASCDAKTRD